MIRRFAVWGGIVLVVAVLLVLRPATGAESGGGQAAAPRVPATGAGRGGPALSVTAVTLSPTPLREVISATGTLRAEESVDLVPEIAGKVIEIRFQEGARVRKGDVLVKLNDADLRGALDRATQRRSLAEAKQRRLSQLRESNFSTQQEFEEIMNELNVQRAEVAIAEAALAKTELRAPFDGIVGLRAVSEGAFVTTSTRIASLQKLDQLKLDFSLPEKYAGRVAPGQDVAFSAAGDERKIQGKVYAVDPRIDEATRSVQLRAIAANPDSRLLPGGFANVEITLDEVANALMVPAIAVVPGVTDKTVFVVVNGKAERRTVRTGMRNETSVQILEGLRAGDVVITSGLQQLRAGLAVNVANPRG